MRLRYDMLGVLFLLLQGLAALFADDLKVEARLAPKQIMVGSEAAFDITIENKTPDRIDIPEIDGLSFRAVGSSMTRSSQLFASPSGSNITNSSQITYHYLVGASKPGTYTIPPILVASKGDEGKTEEVQLKVLSENEAPATEATSGQSPSPEAPVVESPAGAQDDNGFKLEEFEKDKPYFLRLDVPDRKVYVGEKFPVSMEFFVEERSGLNDPSPQLEVEGFTESPLRYRNDVERVMIGNQRFFKLVWSGSLTAVKPGTYTVNAKVDAVVPNQQIIRLPGMGFRFDSGKPASIRVPTKNIEVIPLPEEGRPAGFSGAVGKFVFETEATPTRLIPGDPIDLKGIVKGKGNFDRMDWKGMEADGKWKTYPVNERFNPLDKEGLVGSKVFTQAVIPQDPVIRNVPGLTFSYFDPEEGGYKTLHSAPIPIEITASQTMGSSRASGDGTSTADSFTTVEGVVQGLLPNRILGVSLSQDYQRSLLGRSWFVACLVLPCLLLAGATARWFLIRFPGLPAMAAVLGRKNGKQEQLAHEMSSLSAAVRQGDSAVFALSARRVLQLALSNTWRCPPEAVTRHEVRQKKPFMADRVESIFAFLDAYDYSGAELEQKEMQRIEGEIREWLEKRK